MIVANARADKLGRLSRLSRLSLRLEFFVVIIDNAFVAGGWAQQPQQQQPQTVMSYRDDGPE